MNEQRYFPTRGGGSSVLSTGLRTESDGKGLKEEVIEVRPQAEESYVRIKRSDLERLFALVERLERRIG